MVECKGGARTVRRDVTPEGAFAEHPTQGLPGDCGREEREAKRGSHEAQHCGV